MDIFGLTDPKEYCGRKCYSILHGEKEPCPFCMNKKLAEDQEYQFEYYNEQLGRWYGVTARRIQIKGRSCCLNIAKDITAEKEVSYLSGGFTTFYEKESSNGHLELTMFRSACRSIRGWIEKGLSFQLSVDFSHVTLLRPNMVKVLREICAENSVPPSALTIKVMESIRAMEHKQLERLIISLEGAGFYVKVDDFSLYLKF